MTTLSERLALWYRWEFLRRNREYRDAFDAFAAKHANWFASRGRWYDPESKYSNEDRRFIREHMAGEVFSLKTTFDINRVIPYEWTFEKTGKFELRPGVFVQVPDRVMRHRHGDVRSFAVSSLAEESGWCSGWEKNEDVPRSFWDSMIYFRVDITFPVETVLAKIEKEIRAARRTFRQTHGSLPRREVRPRRRFEEFDCYLQVWDLKKQGLSLPKIARKVYPDIDALERVTDHYRRANELIAGGYREIE
jgi:hypothetical protein